MSPPHHRHGPAAPAQRQLLDSHSGCVTLLRLPTLQQARLSSPSILPSPSSSSLSPQVCPPPARTQPQLSPRLCSPASSKKKKRQMCLWVCSTVTQPDVSSLTGDETPGAQHQAHVQGAPGSSPGHDAGPRQSPHSQPGLGVSRAATATPESPKMSRVWPHGCTGKQSQQRKKGFPTDICTSPQQTGK